MVSRQQRMDDFDLGEPPAGEPIELLCEDHNGTYMLPFPCRWADGAWHGITSGVRIEANVLGWRRTGSNGSGRTKAGDECDMRT
jgi:hypothetical protein